MKKIYSTDEFKGLRRYPAWRDSWENKDAIDIFSYISNVCNPEDVLLFCKILFPDFIEEKNAIILARNFDAASFDVWFSQLDGDVAEVERILNHTHVYDIFSGCPDDVEELVFEQLSEAIAVSWRLILRDKFPSKDFIVEATSSEQQYGPIVTFFQGGRGDD
ncbi:hypothetical protein [Pseudomonas nicosulfuronedens]